MGDCDHEAKKQYLDCAMSLQFISSASEMHAAEYIVNRKAQ